MLEWATSIIETGGYLGIVFAMFIENIIPPIPSELVMLFAGASAATGDLHIALVIIAGAVGSSLGLIPWYFAGKWYSQKRLKKFADKHGRLLTFSGKDVEASEKWFKNHGKKAVFFSRFVPAFRTLVAIPAAIMEMDLLVFLAFASLGSLIWDGIFAVIGFLVGENAKVLETYIDIASYVTLGVVFVWYIYRVIRFKK